MHLDCMEGVQVSFYQEGLINTWMNEQLSQKHMDEHQNSFLNNTWMNIRTAFSIYQQRWGACVCRGENQTSFHSSG